MKVKEILIVSQPTGNRGDESAHRALVRSLNRELPDVHVTVIAFMDYNDEVNDFIVENPQNEYVHFHFPHNMMARPCAIKFVQNGMVGMGTRLHPILRKLVPYYQRADLVLCAPGGICMGGFQNWRHLYLLELARVLHKPIAYYSRSIGPFPEVTPLNRTFKKISMNLLHHFDFISLRDSKSKRLADELGVKYVSAIDTAFLESPSVEIPTTISSQLQEKYVVFVPNELTWHFAYRHVQQSVLDDFFVKIIGQLRQSFPGHQIVMLPQLCSLGERGDERYFKKLKQQVGGDDIFVVPDTYGSDVQQTIIHSAQMVIGARYHTIVFSVNNEVPFVALGYEHKIPGLLEELSLSAHVVDITKAFENGEATEKTLFILSEKIEELKTVRPERRMAHQMASDCLRAFVEFVKKK